MSDLEKVFELLAGAGRLPGQRRPDGSWAYQPDGCNCEACADGPQHSSDCAVHNEPAYPNGPCSCEETNDEC